MNFSQLHERLRVELRRRIERGTLSVSLLSRQTGLGQPHVSNFLSGRRAFSLATLDKVLAAQRLTIADLQPATHGALLSGQMGERGELPLVAHSVALMEPYIRMSSVQRMVSVPAELLSQMRPRCTAARRAWERFVVVQLSAADSEPMDPVLRPDALAVIDRHYNSLLAYRPGEVNMYAARSGSRLVVRFADFQADRLVLRARNPAVPVEVIELAQGETPNDLLAGRVVLVMNEV
jgi:hypothetical protein